VRGENGRSCWKMQSESRRGGREIVVSFGPRQRPQVESSGGRFRDAGRSRHVFRVTHCTVLAEWTTALIAVGLLSFYLYAILDTRTDKQRDNIQYKVWRCPRIPVPSRFHPLSCSTVPLVARLPYIPSRAKSSFSCSAVCSCLLPASVDSAI